MDINDDKMTELINDYAAEANDSAFNIKRASKKMGDQAFDKFLNGVLPIQEYKLTLEVTSDGKQYSTSIGNQTVKVKKYIRLGNTTCLKIQTDEGVHLVDVNSQEYKEIIGAYTNDKS